MPAAGPVLFAGGGRPDAAGILALSPQQHLVLLAPVVVGLSGGLHWGPAGAVGRPHPQHFGGGGHSAEGLVHLQGRSGAELHRPAGAGGDVTDFIVTAACDTHRNINTRDTILTQEIQYKQLLLQMQEGKRVYWHLNLFSS